MQLKLQQAIISLSFACLPKMVAYTKLYIAYKGVSGHALTTLPRQPDGHF